MYRDFRKDAGWVCVKQTHMRSGVSGALIETNFGNVPTLEALELHSYGQGAAQERGSRNSGGEHRRGSPSGRHDCCHIVGGVIRRVCLSPPETVAVFVTASRRRFHLLLESGAGVA